MTKTAGQGEPMTTERILLCGSFSPKNLAAMMPTRIGCSEPMIVAVDDACLFDSGEEQRDVSPEGEGRPTSTCA